MQEERQN